MRSLGDAIRRARMSADLSQGELANRLGVSQGTISFWERDVEVPRLDHMVKLLIEFPRLADSVRAYDHELIRQLQQIERTLFNGKCACENCNCANELASSAPNR